MTINFKCKKCRREFDCDMGKIGIDDSGMRPTFEKDIVSPWFDKLTMDGVFFPTHISSYYKVLKGDYEKNRRMHDPDIDDETLEVFNELFTKIAENERPAAAKYIWHPNREKPKLKMITGGVK